MSKNENVIGKVFLLHLCEPFPLILFLQKHQNLLFNIDY